MFILSPWPTRESLQRGSALYYANKSPPATDAPYVSAGHPFFYERRHLRHEGALAQTVVLRT
jgi:hypothetical protein